MEPLIRVSAKIKQAQNAAQQAACAGRLLQLVANSLYKSGCVPLRCFLFPYVDLLQLESANNAIYFGDFLQFSSPNWPFPYSSELGAAVWPEFLSWSSQKGIQINAKDCSLTWETADKNSFWPGVSFLVEPLEPTAGQKTVSLKLKPPEFPVQREICYRTFAGDYLSVCQIFQRLLQGCGGQVGCFSPFFISYSAPAGCLEKLEDYLRPALGKLAFSILKRTEKE